MPCVLTLMTYAFFACARYIEPALAKQVAEGDACPITLKAMEDINPTFVPRALKPLRMNATTSREAASKDKGKGKMIVASEKPKSSTLHNFFSVYLVLLVSMVVWFILC